MVGEMFDKIDMEFVEYVYMFYGSGMVTHYDLTSGDTTS